MHLHAALVPPAYVTQALVELVRGTEAPVTPRPRSTGRSLFRRSTPEPETPSGPRLDVIPAERLVLPITDFGYVASSDAGRLADAIARVCAELPGGPTVRISGGSALIDPDDRSVWAELSCGDEELDALRLVARSVVSGVEPLGFFRDRRQFRTRLAVATINDDTTVGHLERVLAALSAYRSDPWTVDVVTILQRGSGIWRTVPIGG